jgi:hypothetical protein
MQPAAIHRRKPGVPQPDQLMKQRGRMFVVIREAEIIPARVHKLPEPILGARCFGLRTCLRIPLIGSKAPP